MEFIKEFKPNKRYVFDKDIYKEYMAYLGYGEIDEIEEMWTNAINNEYVSVIDNRFGEIKVGELDYSVVSQWCREVPNIRILTENDL